MSLILCFFLAAIVVGPPPTTTSFASNHESLLEGAKKKGKLVVYTSMTLDQAQKLNDAFKAKYPFIQPSMFRNIFGAPKS